MKERPSTMSTSGYSVCVKSCRLLFMMLTLFTMLMQPVFAQGNIQVTGVVSDASGAPMPGVNVVVKGTTTGVISGSNGDYSLRVPNAQAVLQFSFIGYLAQEIMVGNQTRINVTMVEDAQALEEVVVIGYGTVKKSDLTGSVASVNMEELMKRRPVSLEQGMQGMAAGVQVIRNSGQPGSGTTVRIRGTATINNSAEPLYVIDGIMVGSNANFLNPNDVESIEILKDASATAIYGSRGANGVIMITTKKGAKGRINLNFDASFGLQTPGKKIEVANAAQFATAANQVSANDNTAYNPVWASPSSLNYIDWQDEMSRNSLMQQYNLSASGGSDNTQAMMSIGYTDNEGIILASKYNRITARANITHNVKDFIRTGLNISYMHSESQGGGNLFSYASMIPTMDTLANGNILHVPVRYPDGTYGHFPREGNGFNNKGADNPVAQAELADSKSLSDRTLVNAYAEIDLLEGLTFRTVTGANFSSGSSHNYSIKHYRSYLGNPTDDFSINANSSMEYLMENYFTYAKSFNDHRLTLLAGYSVSKGYSRTASASASEFPVPTIRRVELTSNTATQTGSGGFGADTRQQSFFGRVLYSYADRYSLTATIRRDGSSNFGAGNVYGTFPSLAVAWRITEEDFMKDQNLFSNLKLRAGWGQTGNAGNTTNLSVDQVSSNRIAFYFFDPVSQTFTTAGGLAQVNEIDTNLQWETNEQINVGLDMGFLANALTLTVDYFRRDAKELLLYKGLRPSTGFTQIYTNAGHIRNSGLEFQLGYQKRWGDWDLGVKANGTIVKNEAVDVGPDIYSSSGVASGSWWSSYSLTRNGYPVGSYFGWRSDGIFQTQSEIDALNAAAVAAGGSAYQASAKPGDRKFKDLDGNGWVSDTDREILGDGYPDLTYGFTFSLGWKDFDFNLYLYGVTGQDILSYSYRNLISMMDPTGSGLQNVLADYALNAYTDANKSNVYPRVTKADPNHNGQISDAFIRNGDFLKIQNLQVGYTLPKRLLSSLKMESARIFVSVDNLLTISKYDVGDPEVGSSNVMQTGFDGGRYPFPRIYTFGINFGF